MKMSFLKVCAVVLTCSMAAEADTITSRDSRSWNGQLVQLKNGILTLAANFPAGKTSLQFGPNTLRGIEFNPTAYNPGAAPKLAPVNAGSLSGTIYLRDKSGHPCGNIAIDANNVSCSAGSWPRANVMRIIFDAR
jgi:hypothetical protein